MKELERKKLTNFSVIGPNNCNPGKISASGLFVSTVVETIAIYHPLGATIFALDTKEI